MGFIIYNKRGEACIDGKAIEDESLGQYKLKIQKKEKEIHIFENGKLLTHFRKGFVVHKKQYEVVKNVLRPTNQKSQESIDSGNS